VIATAPLSALQRPLKTALIIARIATLKGRPQRTFLRHTVVGTGAGQTFRRPMRKPKSLADTIKPLVLAGLVSVPAAVSAVGDAKAGDTADFARAPSGPNVAKGKATPSLSEPKPFIDPLLQTMTLVSKINGSEYEIRISLPTSYGQTTKAYPVMLVLDGESFFLTSAEVTRNEQASSTGPLSGGSGPIPEFIVVSIALPSSPPNPFRRNFEFMPPAKREDLAPTMRAFMDQAVASYGGKIEFGGASTFMKVIETEILTGVASHYRVDSSQRMLFGHSAGGTFAAYVLTTRPELFTDYIIASPGLLPENFREEELWAADHKELRARVLLTAGEKEINDPLTIASGTVRFAEMLNSRNYRGLELQTWIIPDASHNQTAIPSMVRGLFRSGRPRG
jgi:predicted alpha/beta superfamily hydrolase